VFTSLAVLIASIVGCIVGVVLVVYNEATSGKIFGMVILVISFLVFVTQLGVLGK